MSNKKLLDASCRMALAAFLHDIGKAIDEAGKVFRKTRMTSRILVIITDGEDHEGNLNEVNANGKKDR